MGTIGAPDRRAGGSLTRRTIAVSVLLSVIIGSAFFLLALAISALRSSEARADHALEVLVATNRLERLAADIEATQHGYITTGQGRFLQPWHQAQARYQQQAVALERLASAGDEGQGRRARQLAKAGQDYIDKYSIPLVTAARRDPSSARTVALYEEGRRRLNAQQNISDQLMVSEKRIFAVGHQRAVTIASWALPAASVSTAGSIVLILLCGGYLARSVIRPVRRASAMAGQVAGGDLAVRMPETAPGEVGSLERSFNSMAGSLTTSRDELRRVAEGQAALRRVATLVARGVSPPEVFGAVAAETGRVLGPDTTAVARYEPDGTAMVVGSWEKPGTQGLAMPVGSRWPTREDGIARRVQRTGEAVQVSSCDSVGGATSAWIREHGIRFSGGSPIIVDGQVWGVMLAFSRTAARHPEEVEDRMLAFTELVAMAVANTESRAQLAASRARVVAAADETRRRIERDLHDGTQQRLISLALELRAAQALVPPEQRSLVEQWSRTAQGLTDVVQELREISRGLHPVILEKGGLRPALRALARRAGLPVEVDVKVSGRLPERVEVAAYYVVSEALTNAAKHARASVVEVDVGVVCGGAADDVLRLLVRDDGVGGADPSFGSGLIGLSDRVEAVGGKIEVTSPPGGGTSLLATIPLSAA